MSQIKLTPGATGAGVFTIASPTTGTDRTLTLPDATDTIAGIAATQTLTNKSIVASQLTGTVAVARLPAGSVLQVVSATYGTQVSNSTSTYVDTGLTATITPSSASNKILVFVNQVIYKSNGNSANHFNMRLYRDSTSLGLFLNAQLYTGTAIELYGNGSLSYLDSPATTSATTYKTQFASGNNTASVLCQPDSSGKSTITLMEIAA